MAWSRIHCLAFSRLPAAIRLEFDELLLNGLDELVLSLASVCEPWRPHRAGFSDAKKEDVFEVALNRQREDDEDDELGVLRPQVPNLYRKFTTFITKHETKTNRPTQNVL